MAERKKKPVSIKELMEQDGGAILDEMLATGIRPRDEASRDYGQTLLKNLVEQLLDPGMVVAKGVTKTITQRIAAVDELISKQLNEVMHASEFQQLEAAWRGMHQLVMNSETGENMKVRVMNISKKDMLRDFQAAPEFTESALWKKIYEYEFGLYGGDPYGCLVGDYEFDRSPQDVELLDHISHVAAAAHAPFISAAGSGASPRCRIHATSPRCSTRAIPRTPSGSRSATRRTLAS